MADSNVRPLAGIGDEEVFNAVRNACSPQFQVRVPAATQGNIRAAVDAVKEFPLLRDEFTGVLIQRLIGLYVQHADWDDPLKLVGSPREMRRFGNTYEQAAVGLIQARSRNLGKEYLGDDVYGQYRPPTASVFHPLTFDHYYPVTIPEDAVLTAFDGQGGMADWIAEIMNAPILSDRNDLYLMKTQCFAEYARKGGFYRVNVPEVSRSNSTADDARAMLRSIQAVANTLKSLPLSAMGRYNAQSWVTPWQESKAILFATPEVIAALNVEALAAAFNMDRANVPYRIIPIPENMFGIGGDSGKVQAVLTTEDFFFQWDELFETTNSPVNPIDGSRNVFLKHRGSITPNPFANAILFWTGEASRDEVSLPADATAATPKFQLRLAKYGNPSATPQNVSRGDLVQVVSEISTSTVNADFTPTGIRYELEGATSQFTRIDNDGILRCGLDETADTIMVKAQATYINPATPEIDQTVSAALSVPVVGQWMGGFKPGVIETMAITPDGDQSLKAGAKLQLHAVVTKSDGSKADVTNLATWTVDGSDGFVTVEPNGMVTAVKAGVATVKAKFAGSASATEKVTVTA
ncbi:hypothetical protein [uncultured Bifidobacterium sp.]|uniref:hypothetical protein n=1 Tax=uncultured Bifidobacterium sp. TaxID=165187 RepID=UPI00260A68E2|nr:hypothetical protein [uncultured Bifidobacterium sp.]